MASYTTNLNLKKPAGSENVAIGDINNNMDTIDQAYGTLNSKINLTTATKIVELSIAVSGDTDWHSEQHSIGYTGAKYIVIIAGPHGAIKQTLVVPTQLITAMPESVRVSSMWDSNNLGEVSFNRSLSNNMDIIAKTKDLAFDYVLYFVE